MSCSSHVIPCIPSFWIYNNYCFLIIGFTSFAHLLTFPGVPALPQLCWDYPPYPFWSLFLEKSEKSLLVIKGFIDWASLCLLFIVLFSCWLHVGCMRAVYLSLQFVVSLAVVHFLVCPPSQPAAHVCAHSYYGQGSGGQWMCNMEIALLCTRAREGSYCVIIESPILTPETNPAPAASCFESFTTSIWDLKPQSQLIPDQNHWLQRYNLTPSTSKSIYRHPPFVPSIAHGHTYTYLTYIIHVFTWHVSHSMNYMIISCHYDDTYIT